MKYHLVIVSIFVFLAGCVQNTPNPTFTPASIVNQQTEEYLFVRDDDVPELPFDDNPDPAACGIPTRWGLDDPAWLSGYYEGELIQPTVFLYDSHLRISIEGQAPTGSQVKIIMFQENPTLDYYLVETIDTETPQQGWVPAPFVSFDQPAE